MNEIQFKKLDILGSGMLGVYINSSNDYMLAPNGLESDVIESMEEVLDVEAIEMSVGGSDLVGVFSEINSNGVLFSDIVDDSNIIKLEERGLNVGTVSGNMNTTGNLVLANSKFAFIHPDLSEEDTKLVEEVLDVEVFRTTISGIKNVGAAGILTNRGLLLHPMTGKERVDEFSEMLKISVDVGTVNYGMPMVGSGAVANDKGFLSGSRTTGPELGRIEETLFMEGL